MTAFAVIRVNGDDQDTHAGRDVAEALELAQPDPADTVEVQFVHAATAALARLLPDRACWVRWRSR
jgi:hypothetical protein